MGIKKKHPQGVEQFADSHNTQANATPQDDIITLEGQMSLFDAPPLKVHNKVRLIELFSGIGAQAKAMQRLGVDWESWGAYDIDPYAVKAYNTIYGTDYVPTDICQMHGEDLNIVDRDKYTYIMTYSFPCQDLSLAGKRAGMKRGSGTRSGLLWEVERLLRELGDDLPQILVMENVRQVIGVKNKRDFDSWREALTEMGYDSQYQVMNAKDYGVAQNRERCFMVSWLGDYSYTFPKAIPLARKLRDYLVSDVDDKYFLTDEQVSSFVSRTELNNDPKEWANVSALAMGRVTKWHQRGDVYPNDGSVGTLTATMYKTPPLVGWGVGESKTKTSGMRIPTNNKRGYEEIGDGDFLNLQYATSSTRRGRVGKQIAQTLCCTDEQAVALEVPLEYDDKAVLNDSYVSEKGVKFILDPKRGMLTDINPDVAIPLTRVGQRNWSGSFISPDIDHIEKSSTIGSKVPTDIYLKNGEKITSDDDTSHLRIRKLTPLECWRLMDFDDEDFRKAEAIESNTQLYAQAGNSIVVNCLVAIFGQMFEGKEHIYEK